MSYEPTTWKSGDVVTSSKLNKMEKGIEDANAGGGGGGGVLRVGMDMETMALDKTYAEIVGAVYAILCVEQGGQVQYAPLLGSADAGLALMFLAGNQQMRFVAESADGYPVYQQQGS